MANNENLKSNSERTPKERKELARKAGKASGEVRRARKTMKEMLDYLLTKEVENKKGDKASTLEAISVALIKKAMGGDTKAFEVIRDTIGEKFAETSTSVNIVQPVQINKKELNNAIKDIMNLADEG